MINVEIKHDVKLGKAAGLMVILGSTIGASIVVSKEVIEYSKKKIKGKNTKK